MIVFRRKENGESEGRWKGEIKAERQRRHPHLHSQHNLFKVHQTCRKAELYFLLKKKKPASICVPVYVPEAFITGILGIHMNTLKSLSKPHQNYHLDSLHANCHTCEEKEPKHFHFAPLPRTTRTTHSNLAWRLTEKQAGRMRSYAHKLWKLLWNVKTKVQIIF